MAQVIRIRKHEMKKDAIRINCDEDIPDFLFGAIIIDPIMAEIVLDCVEGVERAPLGSVIGYEPNADGTWNTWCIGNATDSLVEIDGVFWTKPVTYEAQEISDNFPEFLRGADITRNLDGSWSLKTNWGTSTGWPGKAYWVLYGVGEDGTISANILTKSQDVSMRAYDVVDDDGNIICPLPELDAI